MDIGIKVPKLLEKGRISEINDKILSKNHSFAFLGEEEVLLNRKPSSYAEAFEMYVNGLYKVYHEFGMDFLKCCCNETIRYKKNSTFSMHIRFIEKCRGAILHSGDDGSRSWVYDSLKKYVFSRSNFMFSDWNDFWLNADDNHWKYVTEKIVRDSDRLYTDLLSKLAEHSSDFMDVCDAVAEDFKNSTYTWCCLNGDSVENKNCVDMYDSSLNGRFFRIISQKLKKCSSFQSKDADILKNELHDLINPDKYKDNRTEYEIAAGKKTPAEIKQAVIDVIKKDLRSENNFDFKSETLYNDVIFEVENQIRKQIASIYVAEYNSILS